MDVRYITHCTSCRELDGTTSVHVVEHGPKFGFDWHMEYDVRRGHVGHVVVDVVRLAPDYCPFPSYVTSVWDLPPIVREQLEGVTSCLRGERSC